MVQAIDYNIDFSVIDKSQKPAPRAGITSASPVPSTGGITSNFCRDRDYGRAPDAPRTRSPSYAGSTCGYRGLRRTSSLSSRRLFVVEKLGTPTQEWVEVGLGRYHLAA